MSSCSLFSLYYFLFFLQFNGSLDILLISHFLYQDIAGTLATEDAEDASQVSKLRSALESVDHRRRKVGHFHLATVFVFSAFFLFLSWIGLQFLDILQYHTYKIRFLIVTECFLIRYLYVC